MKCKLLFLILVIVITNQDSISKELKQKKGFKVPDNTAFVTTLDVNLDKVKDYIVQSPEQITIYNGKDNTTLYSIQLDTKSDESFLIDLNSGKFTRPDLVKDLNGNGVVDIPIRGLNTTGGEYLKIIDPSSSEKILETRFAPNSDNLFIYDIDGNDTLDVIIERLDSVLIFSSTVVIPSSINISSPNSRLATLFSYPNPMRQSSTIVWSQLGGNREETVVAVISDMRGHEIRRVIGEKDEKNAKFVWDGRSNVNSDVPNGVYFVKVSTNASNADATIVVSR